MRWWLMFVICWTATPTRAGVEEASRQRDEAVRTYRIAVRKYPPTNPENRAKRKELYNQIVVPAKRNFAREATKAMNKAGSHLTGAQLGLKNNPPADSGEDATTGEAFETEQGGGKSIRNTESLDGSGIKPEIQFEKHKKSPRKK